ncbi:MAG TPA: IS3 family transposase, partial [Clostridium sp.]|nr:IS3 family transposase [Clostridium sp.]
MLKKLELSERQVRKNKLQPALIFELIKSTVDTLKANRMASHLCEIANVSTYGYYNHLNSRDTRQSKEEHDLKPKEVIVKAIKYKNKPKGSRQVKMIVENVFGIIMNRKCIQRIMRKYGVKCKVRKANPYRRMMKATREHTVVPNKLNREFKQEVAGKALLTV